MPVDFTQEEILTQMQAMREDFETRMEEAEKRHAQELADVRAAAQPGPPTGAIPEHAGGPGLSVRATWSMHEQELSRAGKWTEPERD